MKAESRGDSAKAEQFQERAAVVVAPTVAAPALKVQGESTREVWKFEVTDPTLVPRPYLVVDESAIRKVVQALKGGTDIPGVRVYSEKQLASGT